MLGLDLQIKGTETQCELRGVALSSFVLCSLLGCRCSELHYHVPFEPLLILMSFFENCWIASDLIMQRTRNCRSITFRLRCQMSTCYSNIVIMRENMAQQP
jgi:hypothetical protein